MSISPNTKLYISASSKPGSFGLKVYNHLFEVNQIDAIYIPLKVENAHDLAQAIRTLGISGCSVSMPLKTQILPFLDQCDELASELNSVNTIVNTNGILKGFNTDFYGALSTLRVALQGQDLRSSSVLVYGAGAVALSVIKALRDLGCTNITVTARNEAKLKEFVTSQKLNAISSMSPRSRKFDWLINVTPASSDPSHLPLFKWVEQVSCVFDLVVAPKDTALIEMGKNLRKATVSGVEMAKFQLQAQYELYTGAAAEISKIEKVVSEQYLST